MWLVFTCLHIVDGEKGNKESRSLPPQTGRRSIFPGSEELSPPSHAGGDLKDRRGESIPNTSQDGRNKVGCQILRTRSGELEDRYHWQAPRRESKQRRQMLSALQSVRVSGREWNFCACSTRTRTLGTAPPTAADVTSGDGGGVGALGNRAQVARSLPPPRGPPSGAPVPSAAFTSPPLPAGRSARWAWFPPPPPGPLSLNPGVVSTARGEA